MAWHARFKKHFGKGDWVMLWNLEELCDYLGFEILNKQVFKSFPRPMSQPKEEQTQPTEEEAKKEEAEEVEPQEEESGKKKIIKKKKIQKKVKKVKVTKKPVEEEESEEENPVFERDPEHKFVEAEEVYVIDKNEFDIYEAVIQKVEGDKYHIHYPDYPQDDEVIEGTVRIVERNEANKAIYADQEASRLEKEEN